MLFPRVLTRRLRDVGLSTGVDRWVDEDSREAAGSIRDLHVMVGGLRVPVRHWKRSVSEHLVDGVAKHRVVTQAGDQTLTGDGNVVAPVEVGVAGAGWSVGIREPTVNGQGEDCVDSVPADGSRRAGNDEVRSQGAAWNLDADVYLGRGLVGNPVGVEGKRHADCESDLRGKTSGSGVRIDDSP